MKKLLLPLVVFSVTILLFSKVNAQNVTIGVRGGLSIPNLTAGSNNQNPLNTGYSSRSGLDAGLFAEFKVSDLFSIQPMLQYSSQGGKKDGFQAFPTPAEFAAQYPSGAAPTYLYATFNSTAKLNYLLLPILTKFGWNFHSSPLRIYIDAGPFVGLLLNAKQVTSGSSNFYLDPKAQMQVTPEPQSLDANDNIKDQLHTFNLGLEGNLGLAYKFKKSSIFIEGGGNYGFLNIQKGTANGKNETGAATIDIGYSFLLGK